MKNMRKATILFAYLFLAFIIGGIFYILSNDIINKEPVAAIDTGWQYLYLDTVSSNNASTVWTKDLELSKAWRGFSIPGQPPKVSNKAEVWVRVPLPAGSYTEPSILFMTFDQIFDVYMDGKSIYHFGNFDTASKNRSPGSPWHIIDLPDNYTGKYMYLHMYAVRNTNIGLIKRFDLDNRSTHIINIVKSGLINLILAFLFVFVGICSVFVFIIRRKSEKLFLWLSLSSLTVGIWLLASGSMKQFFINSPGTWIYIEIISQYSIPIFFSALLNNILKSRYKLFFTAAGCLSALVLTVSLALDLFHVMPLVCTLPSFYITFGMEMLSSILIIIKSFSKWTTELKIFSSGLIFLCVLGLFDIYNWNFNVRHKDTFFTQWGMVIFLFSLTLILIFHFIRAEEKVSVFSQEIKSKEIILTERQRELEEARINDKLKTEFFSNISHELRTPLNIILSTLQLLFLYEKDGSLLNGQRNISQYLKIMKQNSYRLIRLVNNIIDITRIDSGYLHPKFQNYNIVSIVEDITLSVADYIKSKGISLTFDTDVEERIIACDPDKIERIILNLLSNAVKFSNPGSSIYVNIKDLDSEMIITVEDTGIGMEEDKLNVIFERFSQVDRSLTRNHEGSGIGLSLVKSLVEMHKGTIRVESVYGEGSKFIISLPCFIVQSNEEDVEDPELHVLHVEKVNIEFSDIYS